MVHPAVRLIHFGANLFGLTALIMCIFPVFDGVLSPP